MSYFSFAASQPIHSFAHVHARMTKSHHSRIVRWTRTLGSPRLFLLLIFTLMLVITAPRVCLAQSETAPTFRVNSTVVLVPTLVAMPSGEVVYTLKASDFIVEDNGVPQKIQSDEDFNQEPVSVIVAIQKGRTSALQFQKFVKLGPLLDLFLGQGHGEAGI